MILIGILKTHITTSIIGMISSVMMFTRSTRSVITSEEIMLFDYLNLINLTKINNQIIVNFFVKTKL